MTQCFVGGSVVATVDGVEECAEGAAVVVKKDGREVGVVATDTFGEFKIDGLEKNSGQYELEVIGTIGRISTTVEIAADSVYLGVLTLE